jgi:hypothetical protein
MWRPVSQPLLFVANYCARPERGATTLPYYLSPTRRRYRGSERILPGGSVVAGLLMPKENFQCYRLRHISSCKCSEALWAEPFPLRSRLSQCLWLTQRAGFLVLTSESSRFAAGAAGHTCGGRDDASASCARSRLRPIDPLSFIFPSSDLFLLVFLPRDNEKCVVRWFHPFRTMKVRKTLLADAVPIHRTAHGNLPGSNLRFERWLRSMSKLFSVCLHGS